MANQMLALAYDEINSSKANRLRDCASRLEFSVNDAGQKKLELANFCRVRLCPMCTWRRGMKIHAHTTAILDAMAPKGYRYIFVTLTVRNCEAGGLCEALDNMMQGWNRFMGYKAVKAAVHGYYRGLEVTHNVNPDSPSYDTYHPHYHCLFAVRNEYFNRRYMKQEQWQTLWRKAMQLDYNPVVDVRIVKGKTAAAVAEVAKYAVKDADYLVPSDWDLTLDSVRVLDAALHKRRLVAYGGAMKLWHKKLNLDDTEDGDLVHLDGKEPDANEQRREVFVWHVGYRQYVPSC